MHRACSAEGEHRQTPWIDAAVGRVRPGSGSHLFADHLVDAERGLFQVRTEAFFEPAHDGLGARLVERHVAAEEVARIEIAQNEVGIGHGGLCAAAVVTDGSRLRTGAVGPDLHQPERVDPGDAAAACADLYHVDRGDRHRIAAARLETVLPVDFEFARLPEARGPG